MRRLFRRNARATRLTLECSTETDTCTVFFEPEGADVELRSDDRFTVVVSGGHGTDEVEVIFVPEGIVIYAWEGAETSAWDSRGNRLNI